MPIYFADVILDIGWYSARAGRSEPPRARSNRPLRPDDRPATILLYGYRSAIEHLRITYEASDDEDAQRVISWNIAFWRNAITTSSALTSERAASAARLHFLSSHHAVIGGQGDEGTPFLPFRVAEKVDRDADYVRAADVMAAFQPEFDTHLYYAARFLDQNLPIEYRWLCGYLLFEWHFKPRGGLGADVAFREFVELHGESLDPHVPRGRQRAGFLDEIRAVVAHANLANRPQEDVQRLVESGISNTFKAMEHLVCALLTDHIAPGFGFRPNDHADGPKMQIG